MPCLLESARHLAYQCVHRGDSVGVKPFVTSDYMTLVVGVNAQMRGVLKRAADLTVSEYRVLATLLRIGSDATPGELATLLKLSVTSITETAAALVTHGYLERRRGIQDRRLCTSYSRHPARKRSPVPTLRSRATEEGTARLNSTLRELNEAFATDAYPTDEHSREVFANEARLVVAMWRT